MEQQMMIILVIVCLMCISISVSLGLGGYFLLRAPTTPSATPITTPTTPITTPSASKTTSTTPPATSTTPAVIPASTQASTPAPAPVSDCNQIPLYRMHNGGFDHMDSLSNNEAVPTYALDFQIATICSNQAKGTTGLYRGYKSNGQHMSTTTLSELTNNGFTPDYNSQPIGYVYTSQISSNLPPIYRLYNGSNSDHMTSPNATEASPAYVADWNGTPMFYSAK